MNSESQSVLASVLTILTGIWLIISPIFITMTGGVVASVIAVGAVIALAGIAQLIFRDNTIPSWISALAAIYLFVTAFIFTKFDAGTWNMAISAIVAFIFSIWDGSEVQQVHHERRSEHSPAHR